MGNEIADMATFLTELAVWDSYFLGHRCSTVAVASILNATELFANDENFSNIPSTSSSSLIVTLQSLNLLPDNETLYRVRSRLQYVYSRSDQDVMNAKVVNKKYTNEGTISPTNTLEVLA